MAFTVQYTISGGTPNYTVELTGIGVSETNIHSVDGTYSFVNIPEGTFEIDASDSIGCVFPSIPVVLVATTTTIPPATCQLISFDVLTAPSTDFKGSGTGVITIIDVVTPVSAITYSIDSGQTFQGSNIFTDLPSGVYTVVVKDDVTLGCTISGVTRVFPLVVEDPYTIAFSPVREIAGGGLGNGTSGSPYDSGVVVSFSVDGNGGSGFTNPSNYVIAVEQLTIGDDSTGILYGDHGFAVDGEVMFLELPRGRMTTSTESDAFDGGAGCGLTEHSMGFVNATFSGTVLITLNLFLEGSLVDSFGYWISDGGTLPPLC